MDSLGTTLTGSTKLITGGATDNVSVATVTVSIKDNSTADQYWNGSTWDTGPIWNETSITSGQYTASANWQYVWNLPTSDGTTFTIEARATDYYGDNDDPTPASVVVAVDNTVPDASDPDAFRIDGDSTYTTDLNVSLDSSITGATFMRFSETSTTFGPYVAYSSADATTLPAGEGVRTIYAQHKDDEGNETTAIFDSIIVDTQAPTTSGASPADLSADVATDTTISIDFNEDMDPGSITNDDTEPGSTFYIKSGAIWTTATVNYDPITDRATLTPSQALSEGTTYTVYVTTGATDEAGNNMLSAAIWSFRTVQPDATPPSTTLETTSTLDPVAGWYPADTTVTLFRNEPGSTFYRWNAGTTQTYSSGFAALEGQNAISYWSADIGGNTETPPNQTVLKVDTVDPTDPNLTSPNATGTPLGDNTIEANIADATDAASGVEGFSITWSQGSTETPPQTLNASATLSSTTSVPLADGDWWFNLSTKDFAGHWTSTAHIGPFTVDLTTMETSASTAPSAPDGNDSWFVTPPAITLVRNEAGTSYMQWDTSASTGYAASETTTAPEGIHTLCYFSADTFGSTETVKSGTFKVDSAAPVLGTLSATPTAKTQVDLTWTVATDGVSGVSLYNVYDGGDNLLTTTTSTSWSHTGLTPAQSYTYYIKAVDVAGNESGESNNATVTTPNVIIADTGIPIDLGGGIEAIFDDVTCPGVLNILQVSPVVGAPDGRVHLSGGYYEASTNACFNPQITVTLPYSEASVYGGENGLRLIHYEGGEWIDITESIDTTNNRITGKVNNFSPLAITQPEPPGTGVKTNILLVMSLMLIIGGALLVRGSRREHPSRIPFC